jgi:PadR family transcriptional regulator AphA
MPKRTTTSYALLGLLRLRPWTTYELAKQAQKSLNWFWPRAERKLYDEPKHLVAAGLATAKVEATGKRPRTVYAITRAGRTQLLATLDRIEAEALDRIADLTGQAEGVQAFPERLHINALSIRLYFDQERTVLAWARWAREQVEQWSSTTDPADWDAQAVLDELAAAT